MTFAPERFVVLLARQRTGTNALQSVLERHPAIACTREVFWSSRTISLFRARPRTTLGFSTRNSRSVEPSVTTSLRLLAADSMLSCLSLRDHKISS